MNRFDEIFGELMQIETGSGNLGDALLQMNAENLEASGLDDASYVLVRLAALVAIDAPVISYEAVLELAKDAGVTSEQIAGVLVGVAPVVGGPRVLTAASRLVQADGDLLAQGA
jgi:alkylhydroperoxidase/carboxymuconolactone decarboxylase family protein YurZ